jgi:uncharacterized protein YceH (UPF0502 family)
MVLLDGVRQGERQLSRLVSRDHAQAGRSRTADHTSSIAIWRTGRTSEARSAAASLSRLRLHPRREHYARRAHFDELTPPEQRVLGCLIEKRWTTPDQYPLSLNALRLACNQSTNRDPVTAYDEATVRQAADRLTKYGLARLASGHSSRATKYRHLAEEGLGLGREELAVLAVLLLRGPQTPGELKARSDRMASIASLSDVELVLATLADRGYVRRLGRRPGQKEDRFEQLLGGAGASGDPEVAVTAPVAPTAPAPTAPAPAAHTSTPAQANDGLEARVRALEADVAALRTELARLQQAAQRTDGPSENSHELPSERRVLDR